MAEQKNSVLPKLEVLIILIFFLSFLAWSANKCSRTRADAAAQMVQEESELAETAEADTLPSTAPAEEEVITNPITSSGSTTAIDPSERTYLYIIIDGLKMRDAPNLQGELLHQFNLFDRVEFLNEVTDSTTELNLSKTIIVNEPWVKVKNKKGKEGWVYGAGVHYHKQKYPGLD